MNSGRFTTILEVAIALIALASLERRLCGRLLYLVFFFFLPLG